MKMTCSSFLRLAGALGAGLLGGGLSGCFEGKGKVRHHDSLDLDGRITAYKFSTRKTQACKACRNHAANKIYRDFADIVTHRPHAGCSCKIKTLRLTAEEYADYFSGGPIYDVRS